MFYAVATVRQKRRHARGWIRYTTDWAFKLPVCNRADADEEVKKWLDTREPFDVTQVLIFEVQTGVDPEFKLQQYQYARVMREIGETNGS